MFRNMMSTARAAAGVLFRSKEQEFGVLRRDETEVCDGVSFTTSSRSDSWTDVAVSDAAKCDASSTPGAWIAVACVAGDAECFEAWAVVQPNGATSVDDDIVEFLPPVPQPDLESWVVLSSGASGGVESSQPAQPEFSFAHDSVS